MTHPFDYPWTKFGLWMSRAEYIGFLRGRIETLLTSEKLRTEAVQEAMAAMQKLLDLLHEAPRENI